MPDLADGETFLMQGSGAKPYELKNTGGVYSCSCPAWRNQGATIDRRTCKHLKGLRGEEAELARVGVGGQLPARASSGMASEMARVASRLAFQPIRTRLAIVSGMAAGSRMTGRPDSNTSD